MAQTERKFNKGELITAVVIALAVGFFAGTVVMELRQPAASRVQAEGGAGTASIKDDGHEHDAELKRIGELEIATAGKPDDSGQWVELGNLYFDTHQAQKAIVAYQKAIALGVSSPDVWTDLGIMQREAGQAQQALASFDTAIKLNPRHENAWYNKGVVLLHDTGDKAGAAKAWSQLLEIKPDAKTPDGRPLAGIVVELKK
ncbi:MAG: tetratricopeptide repeat protein [Humidesulfovibrio sp.]|uniref:tetratricopeptide repeat protein n=1 Tax=Humidesulfovibrio sp. TaxID=2910988 RepID=UPI0027FAD7FB|nr:tetratricopeptide repeat protein [Humidesulfovibrio sp.]MDQ7836472.1 tetratricopeptide repeat protein [Humidesulfovibrio sp.]